MIYDFGIRLKDLRKAKNLTQTDLAARLEITRTTVSAYERNIKTPSLEILIKMAVIFNVSIDYMLNFNSRSNIYLDDLTESQQDTVKDIISRLKSEFNNNKLSKPKS